MNKTLSFLNSIAESTLTEDSFGQHTNALNAIHLFNGRIFIDEPINSHTATAFALAMLQMNDEKKDVSIFINSPGGEIVAGLMMYDIIRSYKYPIDIYCTGLAASMAAILLSSGKKGHRFILPHSKVMIHEPLIEGGVGGSATTIEKTAQSILEVRSLINGILAENTGKTLEEINSATVFDNFMNAEQAVDFGLCDEIRTLFD